MCGFDAEQESKELQAFHLCYAELDDEESELSGNKLCTFQTQSTYLSDSEDDPEDQSDSDAGEDSEDQSGEFACNKGDNLDF